jgi:hypothetical protein
MPESTFAHPLFGSVRFRTAHPTWVRGDAITFLSGFDTQDIKSVTIPQLANIPGSNHGVLRFHKRAHAQVLAVFTDIERLGLMHHIQTCDGALNFRLRKPTSGVLSKLPSNHAFGIAIDLNADDGSLGASVAPVAPIFEAFKFKWGKSFNDPMHFEVESFIDHPRSIVQDVAVILNRQPIELAARNLMGNLVADVSKANVLPGVSVEPATGQRMKFTGPSRTQVLSVERFDDALAFVSFPQLCAIAGLSMTFDNDAKVATLVAAVT